MSPFTKYKVGQRVRLRMCDALATIKQVVEIPGEPDEDGRTMPDMTGYALEYSECGIARPRWWAQRAEMDIYYSENELEDAPYRTGETLAPVSPLNPASRLRRLLIFARQGDVLETRSHTAAPFELEAQLAQDALLAIGVRRYSRAVLYFRPHVLVQAECHAHESPLDLDQWRALQSSSR